MTAATAYPPIGDYALIGDGRSAALVSRDGSIDWLCWPRFDSPALFGALLDRRSGGRFAVRPVGSYDVERRYIGRTNVLETTFTTPTARVQLRDLMPVATEAAKRRALTPDSEILRLIECLDGRADIEIVFDPRPEYGRVTPRLVDRGAMGTFIEHRGQLLVLRHDVPLRPAGDRQSWRTTVSLGPGQRLRLSLSLSQREAAILPPLGGHADARLAASLAWWEHWAEACRYEGPYRDAVLRSALTLKLMTYAPSGAIVAAPTTSLPEQVGGVRNWDYRYCWLRDASLTLRALYALGYLEEGRAFLSWLLHATRLTQPELQIVYDVFGETKLAERELAHLEGYAGSRPVRVGNDAAGQLQLDTYGEVVDAAYRFVCSGGRLDRSMGRTLVGFGRTVCRRWQEPDEGIWEIRSGRRHHTFSKCMCWIALDRLIALHEAAHLQAPVDAFRDARHAIERQIETDGYNARLHSYVSVLGGDDVDASLLLMLLYGYRPAGEARIRSTFARVHERLGHGPLLYRYRAGRTADGLPGGEGAFGICSFWGVECRARLGDQHEAEATFQAICGYANDVGLFGEEIDPATGGALGNFPQAFTHVGLINAAVTLEESRGRLAPPPSRPPAARGGA